MNQEDAKEIFETETQETNSPFLRVSNERYAADATFEDRLSFEDRELLSAMGICL